MTVWRDASRHDPTRQVEATVNRLEKEVLSENSARKAEIAELNASLSGGGQAPAGLSLTSLRRCMRCSSE